MAGRDWQYCDDTSEYIFVMYHHPYKLDELTSSYNADQHSVKIEAKTNKMACETTVIVRLPEDASWEKGTVHACEPTGPFFGMRFVRVACHKTLS